MKFRVVSAPEPPRLCQLSQQIFSLLLSVSTSFRPTIKHLYVQCLSNSQLVLITPASQYYLTCTLLAE